MDNNTNKKENDSFWNDFEITFENEINDSTFPENFEVGLENDDMFNLKNNDSNNHYDIPQKTLIVPRNIQNSNGKKENNDNKKKIIIISIILLLSIVLVLILFFNRNNPEEEYMTNDYNEYEYEEYEEYEEYIPEEIEYNLIIIDRYGNTETIYGENINFSYYNGIVNFDSHLLNNKISNLSFFTREQILPTNANINSDGENFYIYNETLGNALYLDELRELIVDSVYNKNNIINLHDENLYILPEVTRYSPEIVEAVNSLNTYLQANITYTVGVEININRDLIKNWISVDEYFNTNIYQYRILNWVLSISPQIDTVGTTRTLLTPAGRHVSVSGGYYGWQVNCCYETEALIQNIRNGETISRQPVFVQTAAVHGERDFGDTYILVDLTNQYMWVVQNGNVTFEAPVITGMANTNSRTPQGVYSILEMTRNTRLRGPIDPNTGRYEWDSPVDYWMRVTWSGIGFHDATWQPNFDDRNAFNYRGSRGCINMSLEDARQLFNMIHMNMPVVIHY